MNTKLSQDAHDSLVAHEAQRAFKDAERARWARAQAAAKPCTGPNWAPTMTAQEKQQHDQYVIDNNLPF